MEKQNVQDQITFFVSSTFKDMQGERDALHFQVMPRLREYASMYGRHVDFVDLRWGITTDDLEREVGSNKILGVCLDEIRDCYPYMIVILGERYGWMPPVELIRETGRQKNFIVPDDPISVTELEILYGIWLNEGQLERCIFCMREDLDAETLTDEERSIYLPGSEEDRRRMDRLKTKIKENPTAQILTYSLDLTNREKSYGLYDDFSEKLTVFLKNLLHREWGDVRPTTWIEKQEDADLLITQELSSRFSGREEYMRLLKQASSGNFFAIYGKKGCGMSSIVTMFGLHLQEMGKKVRIIYCGNGFCSNTEQLLKILCAELEGVASEDEFREEKPSEGQLQIWKEKWDQLAISYSGKPIFFVIEGIHHLISDEGVENLDFLPSHGCSDNIGFVVSTDSDLPLNPLALERLNRLVTYSRIPDCEEGDVREIVTSRLRADHKQIGDAVMKTILNHPLSSNMVCLELMIRDIMNLDRQDFAQVAELEKRMSGNDAIAFYLQNIITQYPETEQDLIIHWISRTVNHLAEHDKVEVNCIYNMLFCMGSIQGGASVEELEDIAEYHKKINKSDIAFWSIWWQEARFARLRRFLGDLLRKTVAGKYEFTHEQMTSALYGTQFCSVFMSGMIYYFNQLPDDSEMKQVNFLPVLITYASNSWDRISAEKKEEYFFGYIEKIYIHEENRNALRRIANGIRKNLLYGNGEKRLNVVCRLLREKSANGVPTTENVLRFFCGDLYDMLWQRTTLEESIAVCYLIAIAQGYEQWEETDKKHPKPDPCAKSPELGVYGGWDINQRRNLAIIMTRACERYHHIHTFIQCSQAGVYTPAWEWKTLRAFSAKCINLLIVEKRTHYLCYLASRITILDAEEFVFSDPIYSVECLKLGEKYCKNMKEQTGRASRVDHPDVFIRWYMDSLLAIGETYIKIADVMLEKEKSIAKSSDGVGYHGGEICRKGVKTLKKLGYIKKETDLPGRNWIAYSRIIWNGMYQSGITKQNAVNKLWDFYLDARKREEWMRDYPTLIEISQCGEKLIEYFLDGYIPYTENASSAEVTSYAVQLLQYEGAHLAEQSINRDDPKAYYQEEIIRILDVIRIRESDMEKAKELCRRNADILEKNIKFWENSTDYYILKNKKLLRWYQSRLI